MAGRSYLIVVMALLAVGLGGCESVPELKPNGRVVIPVHAEKPTKETTVQLLNEVVVELPPIEVPGTRWIIVFNDARYLQQLQPISPRAGGFSVSFLAVRGGRRPIGFVAVPPEAREATPTQRYEVMVQIDEPRS